MNGMDILGGLFFNLYFSDTKVSFTSHKEEIVKWKAITYRYDGMERCNWPKASCLFREKLNMGYCSLVFGSRVTI